MEIKEDLLEEVSTPILERIRTALENYAPKRLIQGRFVDEKGERCVMGVLLPEGIDDQTAWSWLHANGISPYPFSLVNTNNYFEGTPEERYIHVLKTIEDELAFRKGQGA